MRFSCLSVSSTIFSALVYGHDFSRSYVMCAACDYLRYHISLQTILDTYDYLAELSSLLHVGTYTVDM